MDGLAHDFARVFPVYGVFPVSEMTQIIKVKVKVKSWLTGWLIFTEKMNDRPKVGTAFQSGDPKKELKR